MFISEKDDITLDSAAQVSSVTLVSKSPGNNVVQMKDFLVWTNLYFLASASSLYNTVKSSCCKWENTVPLCDRSGIT